MPGHPPTGQPDGSCWRKWPNGQTAPTCSPFSHFQYERRADSAVSAANLRDSEPTPALLVAGGHKGGGGIADGNAAVPPANMSERSEVLAVFINSFRQAD
jgi:hypothetical protein